MNFEKTQEQLDTLRNLTWQNGKLIEQNQQLLDQLENGAGAIGSEIMVGKQSLVDAIEYKGGTSSAEKSLQGIAEDIKEIPNFDQWARLAGVLAGGFATDTLSGHNQNVDAGSITKIIDIFGTFKTLRNYCFRYWDLLEEVILPNCEIPHAITQNQNYFEDCTSLKKVILPNSKYPGTQIFNKCSSLEFIEYGVLIYSTDNVLYSGVKTKLRNVTVGEGSDANLNFQLWSA
jgi:hypothetical protein